MLKTKNLKLYLLTFYPNTSSLNSLKEVAKV